MPRSSTESSWLVTVPPREERARNIRRLRSILSHASARWAGWPASTAALSGGTRTKPHHGQDEARSQRDATHDRIEHDRVRPRDVDFEEPDVRHALRGEERESRDRQGDDTQDYQNQ